MTTPLERYETEVTYHTNTAQTYAKLAVRESLSLTTRAARAQAAAKHFALAEEYRKLAKRERIEDADKRANAEVFDKLAKGLPPEQEFQQEPTPEQRARVQKFAIGSVVEFLTTPGLKFTISGAVLYPEGWYYDL